MFVANKYKLISPITSGAFGQLYKGENVRTKELVAIKIESKECIKQMLKYETQIYQYLGNCEGIPQIKWFGSDTRHNYMVITLLGDSLTAIKEQISTPLSLTQTLSISIKMIERVKQMHNKGLIHRDIKPDNFLYGLGKKSNQLHIIDFGFTKRYMKSDNITHIDIKQDKTIIGTPKFVSINMHEGIEPSRRDDLESIGYIMLYLMDLHISDNTDYYTFKLGIEENNTIPLIIKQYLRYCRNLWFEATPDYNYIIQLLQNEI